MENASKALIIAGAILLAILIIGLGMLVFQQAKESITGANLDQETIDATNSKYEAYLGTNVKGSSVKSLCSLVRNNNLVADESETFAIKLTYGSQKEVVDATEINKIISSIGNGKYYSVTATYSTTTKLIETIEITEAGTKTTTE